MFTLPTDATQKSSVSGHNSRLQSEHAVSASRPAHSEHAHESDWGDSTAAARSQYAVRRAARTTHAEPDERTDARSNPHDHAGPRAQPDTQHT